MRIEKCSNCASHVEKALARTPGVTRSQVDLAGKTARVEFDEATVTPEALIESIRSEGYDATPGVAAGSTG